MSSFTDQIVQFNPYIQQLPVDEYLRTGLMKQSQYDQGVQQVQQMVNTVSGLPVVGDANIKMLEGKVSELGQKLGGVLTGDFGKQSLVSQVGSLAGQIARDPNVQAAVTAASQIRMAEQSKIDAQKSGKGYSAANVARLDSYIQEYKNQSDKIAGLSYQGPTAIHNTTGDDVRKKVFDVAAEMEKVYNEDFNVEFDSNNEIMISSKNKTLDKERIKSAIQSRLTEDDRVALYNEGWYTTKDWTDQALVNNAAQDYTAIGNRYAEQAKYYQDILDHTPLNESSRAKYQYLVDINTDGAKTYHSKAQKVVDSVGSPDFNRDDIAGQWYEERLSESVGGSFAFNRAEQKYEVSPYFDVFYKKEQLENQREDLRLKKIAALKDAQDQRSTSPGSQLLPVNPDDPNAQMKFNTQQLSQRLDEIDRDSQSGGDSEDRAIKAWVKGLDTANLKNDFLDPQGRWISAAKKDEARKLAVDAIRNYHTLMADPNSNAIIPNYNKELGAAHNQNMIEVNKGILYKNIDKGVEAGLDPNLVRKANQKTGIKNSNGKELTNKELLDLWYRDTEEKTESLNTGTGGGQRVTYREAKKGSELDRMGVPEVTRMLDKYGISASELKGKKDDVYKKMGILSNPVMRYYQPPVKGKDIEGEEYANALFNSDTWLKGTDIDGNEITPEMRATVKNNPNAVKIQGAYIAPDGKIMMRARIETQDGKNDVIRSVDFDMSSYKSNTRDSFLNTYFLNDSNPELTKLLMTKGSGGRTQLNAEHPEYAGLIVSSNTRVARKYQVAYKPDGPDGMSGTFHVNVLVPIGNGKFTIKTLGATDENRWGTGFPNAGAAIDAINGIYQDINGETIKTAEKEKYFLK